MICLSPSFEVAASLSTQSCGVDEILLFGTKCGSAPSYLSPSF